MEDRTHLSLVTPSAAPTIAVGSAKQIVAQNN